MRFEDVSDIGLTLLDDGEMEVYSVTRPPGYWQKEEANAATFDAGRWMKTGEIEQAV